MPNRYVDLDLDFLRSPFSSDVTKKTDVEAVRRSVRNLILTRHYEKPFHPEIGSNVSNLLFENSSPITVTLLKNEIVSVLSNYEPRVTVIDVAIVQVPEKHEYRVTVLVQVVNVESPVSVSVTLSRVR